MDKNILQKSLTSIQAKKLLDIHGYNEIKQTQKFTLIKAFFSQFENFLTILLLFAAIVSLILGETIDSFFIFLIIVLNALFGIYQEAKAEKSLQALKKMTVTMVRVLRDGIEKEIDARFLIPGDIIHLEQGALVPADAQIIRAFHAQADESALTGESLAVDKSEHSKDGKKLFMGTVIVKGRCWAQVTQTADNTQFGKIARTLSQIEEPLTPLQKKLELFTKQIGIIGMSAAFIVFVLSFIQDKTIIESFIFAVSLAVAAVPEGLPAVMTITLAIGVERMSKKKAIVRKLNAIETLGSVSLIATDKTGTLTQNRMTVKKIWLGNLNYDAKNPPSLNNHGFKLMLENGNICSTASLMTTLNHPKQNTIGDPTEIALLSLSLDTGLDPNKSRSNWKIIDEFPFDSVTKKMMVLAKNNNKTVLFAKGAPESILNLCTGLTHVEKTKLNKAFQDYAKKGLRMIAFSYKQDKAALKDQEKNHRFIGFVGISDPIRPEVAQAVKLAHKAGVKVVMITGDNMLTAEAIAVESGIIKKGESVLEGVELDKYSDEEVLEILPKIKVFARTTPNQKYRLVKLYQKLGEIVAVTGDGVNDVLALKQAEVGVAMGKTGTDVAKETADMIITDDNFATLVGAMEEGRNIFNHIKNAIKYLLSCNIGEVIYILSAVIFGLPLLFPLQLLYINIITDGLPALALAFAPNDPTVMTQDPRKSLSILTKKDFNYIIVVGFLTALLAFLSSQSRSLDIKETITILFSTIIFIQPLILLDLWLSHKPLFSSWRAFSHPVFLAAFFSVFLLQPILLYVPFMAAVFKTTPLHPGQLIFSIIISLGILVILEVLKKLKFKMIF